MVERSGEWFERNARGWCLRLGDTWVLVLQGVMDVIYVMLLSATNLVELPKDSRSQAISSVPRAGQGSHCFFVGHQKRHLCRARALKCNQSSSAPAPFSPYAQNYEQQASNP